MDKKLFLLLVFAFILATIIGTVAHELGHFLVARYLGYHAEINYAMTFFSPGDKVTDVSYCDFLITLGGPLQTMITGTVGLLLIYFYRKSFLKATTLSFGQWGLVFISLFWLRQSANFVVSIAVYFIRGEFPKRADEIGIARFILLPDWSVTLFTALIGLTVLIFVVFKLIPIKQRLTFISSGLVGGVTGYILWLYVIGPVVMP